MQRIRITENKKEKGRLSKANRVEFATNNARLVSARALQRASERAAAAARYLKLDGDVLGEARAAVDGGAWERVVRAREAVLLLRSQNTRVNIKCAFAMHVRMYTEPVLRMRTRVRACMRACRVMPCDSHAVCVPCSVPGRAVQRACSVLCRAVAYGSDGRGLAGGAEEFVLVRLGRGQVDPELDVAHLHAQHTRGSTRRVKGEGAGKKGGGRVAQRKKVRCVC